MMFLKAIIKVACFIAVLGVCITSGVMLMFKYGILHR